jgi:hypothetical protein
MRTFFGVWAGATALALAACGGNVILDGRSAPSAGGGSGIGGFGSPGGAGVGGLGVGGSGTGAAAGGAGGGCAPTCAAALVNGGEPCGDGGTFYPALRMCAGCNDMGNCEGVCGTSLCEGAPVNSDCMSCMQEGCSVELHACQNN